MSPDGILAPSVLTRVERCVALYNAGLAPNVVFTGGTARANGPDAGTQMARYAASIGLPIGAAIVEGRAQSTLQNALFTYDALPAADHLILVTEAFHLPRSFASFRWAAWTTGRTAPMIRLVMSEPVRRDVNTSQIHWRILVRESVAIWFNLVRAFGYTLAPAPDMDWLH